MVRQFTPAVSTGGCAASPDHRGCQIHCGAVVLARTMRAVRADRTTHRTPPPVAVIRSWDLRHWPKTHSGGDSPILGGDPPDPEPGRRGPLCTHHATPSLRTGRRDR